MGTPINSGKHGSRRIVATERQTTALKFRLQGHSFAAIATHMQVSKQRIIQLVKSAMREREATFFETLENARREELMRIDILMATHFPRQATDINEAHLCLRLMERRSAYLGLDSPVEARMMNIPHTHDEPALDLSRLSVDELKTFRALTIKATPTKTEQLPVVVHPPSAGIQIVVSP